MPAVLQCGWSVVGAGVQQWAEKFLMVAQNLDQQDQRYRCPASSVYPMLAMPACQYHICPTEFGLSHCAAPTEIAIETA